MNILIFIFIDKWFKYVDQQTCVHKTITSTASPIIWKDWGFGKYLTTIFNLWTETWKTYQYQRLNIQINVIFILKLNRKQDLSLKLLKFMQRALYYTWTPPLKNL